MRLFDVPHSVSSACSLDRRRFLADVCRTGLATAVSSVLPRRAWAARPDQRKIVVVTFGGGARDEETFAPAGQENIPRLLHELIPQATFYTQVVNRGILGHYVATASLATGVYERFNNFADVSPESPTIFEYFRRDRRRPSSDAWVVAPSNGFNRIGQSSQAQFEGMGASVVLPKRLLAHAGSAPTLANLSHLLTDNYESPVQIPLLKGGSRQPEDVASLLKLSLSDFAAHAGTLTSPDELSLFVARRLMRELAPSVLWITLHDIDIAHTGAFSLYVDAIRRSDTICADLWHGIQTDPEYKDRTNLFILPDFGRDGDTDAGGNGFQHHRTGDALSRTTWMMALGPDIKQNVVVDRPIESIDLVPSLAALLGCQATGAHGGLLHELAI